VVTGTDNELNKELLETSGDDSQYTHVTEEFQVAPPTLEYLTRLKELQSAKETGDCSFLISTSLLYPASAVTLDMNTEHAVVAVMLGNLPAFESFTGSVVRRQ